MNGEETKHDLTLKRIQVTIAILAGAVTFAVGAYNVKQTFFSRKGPGDVSVQVRTDNGQPAQHAASSGSIQSAMEEVGASWIKGLGMPRNKSEGTSKPAP